MTKPGSERRLNVLVADEDQEALDLLIGNLSGLGHHVVGAAVDLAEISEISARERIDASIVVLHGDEQHALHMIGELCALQDGPVIVIGGLDDPDFAQDAAERGVFAVIPSQAADAVQSTLEVTLRRYRETEQLDEKAEELESALQRRAVIERAKGVLMERNSIDEREAFELMRHYARSNNIKVHAVAHEVLDGKLDPQVS